MKLRFRLGLNTAALGSTHENLSLESSLEYIHSCFDDYVSYGQIDVDRDLDGASILEAGPGDNFGLGALFLSAGASRYVGVDPFYARHDGEQQRRIYQTLRSQLQEDQRTRFDRAIDLSSGVRFDPQCLEIIYGWGVTDFARLFPPESFDWIISRAVLEEVHDIEAAFRSMDHVLKPGGKLLHKIDLGDYGIYSGKGHHPLTQLTFSDRIYGWHAADTGSLNRYTLPEYRELLRRMGYSTTIYITCVIREGYPQRELKPHPISLRKGVHYGETEVKIVDTIRPKLAARFRSMATDDLIAGGIFLTACKPHVETRD